MYCIILSDLTYIVHFTPTLHFTPSTLYISGYCYMPNTGILAYEVILIDLWLCPFYLRANTTIFLDILVHPLMHLYCYQMNTFSCLYVFRKLVQNMVGIFLEVFFSIRNWKTLIPFIDLSWKMELTQLSSNNMTCSETKHFFDKLRSSGLNDAAG